MRGRTLRLASLPPVRSSPLPSPPTTSLDSTIDLCASHSPTSANERRSHRCRLPLAEPEKSEVERTERVRMSCCVRGGRGGCEGQWPDAEDGDERRT